MYNIDYMENHAIYFKQYTPSENIVENALAFDVSFLDLQFIGKDKEQVMKALLARLRECAKYEVRNGFNLDEDGKKVQSYTNRVIDLSKDVYAEAIHTYGIDGESTMPHFHFLINPQARLGKEYSLLKKHIVEVAKEFDIRPHFAEQSKGFKKLGQGVKKFTWNIAKNNDKNFVKLIQGNGIDKGLDLLLEYTSKTDNLSYYIKTLESIHDKLKRTKKDYNWRGFNLRHIYPIPLSKVDKEVINIIKKTPTKKEMKKYFEHAIMRDYVRHSAGTTRAYIIESIMRQTTILSHLRKSQKVVEMYIQIQNELKDKNTFEKEKFYRDIMKAVSISKNEKELKEHLQQLGYKGLGFSKTKSQKTGFFYYISKEKKYIPFKDLNTSWSKITQILMSNAKEQTEQLIHTKISYQQKLLFEYYHKHIKHDLSGYFIEKTPKSIKLENKKKNIKIVDHGNRISSAKTTESDDENKKINNEERVKLMIDIAIAKDWKIENIFATGSKAFMEEFEEQKEAIMIKDMHVVAYKNIVEIAKKRAEDEKQIRTLTKDIEARRTSNQQYETTENGNIRDERSGNQKLKERANRVRGELESAKSVNSELDEAIRRRRAYNSKLNDANREFGRLKSEIETKLEERRSFNEGLGRDIDATERKLDDIERKLREQKVALQRLLEPKYPTFKP